MREDDIRGNEECRSLIQAVLELNAEIERRVEAIVKIGREIVLPYFCAKRLTLIIKGHTWTIQHPSTPEELPSFVYEVLNKDIGRTFMLGSYIGDITEKDWRTSVEARS